MNGILPSLPVGGAPLIPVPDFSDFDDCYDACSTGANTFDGEVIPDHVHIQAHGQACIHHHPQHSSANHLENGRTYFMENDISCHDNNPPNSRENDHYPCEFLSPSSLCDSIDGSCSNYIPILPTIPSEGFPHRISCSTMAKLLRGEIDYACYDNIVIVDCRFTHEFVAGHIVGAYNLLKVSQLRDIYKRFANTNACLIFHCELSANRSIKWINLFRDFDREVNQPDYPKLCFSEVYLLEGGYKSFYKQFQGSELIAGGYCPMEEDSSYGKHKLKQSQRLFDHETLFLSNLLAKNRSNRASNSNTNPPNVLSDPFGIITHSMSNSMSNLLENRVSISAQNSADLANTINSISTSNSNGNSNSLNFTMNINSNLIPSKRSMTPDEKLRSDVLKTCRSLSTGVIQTLYGENNCISMASSLQTGYFMESSSQPLPFTSQP
ncbi:hypothetical protein TRFO_01524 [Tritrichomonas foetus]|uniref:protein-tyrosine-phosphatase n=1 Tax=Tritrichomonas foetus TaxID=1144522 RepID=A0A1J4JYQ5_9EUKA|nr:hypothetical protein TRFO_01524 [Tritrichomonas foetus]|eukprot:OHT03826.1 hypothetical protein TRFO_01524 [Tritrichomonas foetus]